MENLECFYQVDELTQCCCVAETVCAAPSMPCERSPRRWTRNTASSASPSSRHNSSQASPKNDAQQEQQQQQRRRSGSNLSTQRRDRTVVWASCLQRVRALRRGGPWVAGDTGPEGYRNDAAGAGAGATGLSDNDGASLVRGASAHSSSMGNAARANQVDDELHEQLDLLAGLTYPNLSIRYVQSAIFMCTFRCKDHSVLVCALPCLPQVLSRQSPQTTVTAVTIRTAAHLLVGLNFSRCVSCALQRRFDQYSNKTVVLQPWHVTSTYQHIGHQSVSA